MTSWREVGDMVREALCVVSCRVLKAMIWALGFTLNEKGTLDGAV